MDSCREVHAYEPCEKKKKEKIIKDRHQIYKSEQNTYWRALSITWSI